MKEGRKRAVAAVVEGLITLLLFTLNPSVKALAMGFQGALGTDFMVPSYLADHVEDVDTHGAVKEKVFKEGGCIPPSLMLYSQRKQNEF